MNSDEEYVLDLISEILEESYEAQKRFDTLRGDSGPNRRGTTLPLDAFFIRANLIVEYREMQHFQPVPIMDRRMTISGVYRGEQRKIYDSRKEIWAADNKIQLLVVSYKNLEHNRKGRLIRNADEDREIIKKMIAALIKF